MRTSPSPLGLSRMAVLAGAAILLLTACGTTGAERRRQILERESDTLCGYAPYKAPGSPVVLMIPRCHPALGERL
jgi:hypothetical protein